MFLGAGDACGMQKQQRSEQRDYTKIKKEPCHEKDGRKETNFCTPT